MASQGANQSNNGHVSEPPSPMEGKRPRLDTNAFNPTPQTHAPTATLAGTAGDRLVLVMVGLPARGKTYIARRVCQYLSFFHGANCKVFNVGSYRRERIGAKTPASFFRADNDDAFAIRKQLAQICMDDMKKWLTETDEKGRIGIYDATNTTRERREWIINQVSDIIPSKSHILFVESVVNDETLVEHNIREVKVSMPDYEGALEKDAIADFRNRINAYKDVYEMMGTDKEEESLSWVRVEDGGRFVAMNRIRGYLQGRICQLLSTLHTMSRPIYLTRHGQSQYNELGKIGGDSSLSEQGESYSQALAKWVHTEILGLTPEGKFPNGVKLDSSKYPQLRSRLYTSSLKRTKETAKHIQHPICADGWMCMRPRSWRNLDEIFAGSFDGMTYEEIETVAPEEFAERARSKLSYRYPRGESYLDVIDRLEPIVMELERQRDPVLIIGHQGILRILYCYFTGRNRDEAPFVPIPLNTVIKLVPGTYSCEEQRFKLINPPSRENPYAVGSPDFLANLPSSSNEPPEREKTPSDAFLEEPPSH